MCDISAVGKFVLPEKWTTVHYKNSSGDVIANVNF